MMIHPADIRRNIDTRLYRLGFAAPAVRHLLGTQIVISAAGLVIGLFCIWFSAWPLVFGVGAAVTTYSLWQISRFAQGAILQQFSAALAIRLAMGFMFRLALISIVLFVLVVQLRAPVAPLVLGLTSTVASMSLWGLTRFSRKTVKEA